MTTLKSNRLSSVIGLALEGRQLSGVVLRRPNGEVRALQSFQATLTLDPLTNDPELVGREIRNHLDAAGVRERHCVVGVPLTWALTLQVKVPAMAEADRRGFLMIEAEKGFPYAPADLAMGTSTYRAENEEYASLVAVPRSQVELLDRALRAARLKPVSFSLGITALEGLPNESGAGRLTLSVGEETVALQVVARGGVAALRTLEGAVEAESGERRLEVDLIARELRITLGQLPAGVREAVSVAHVYGRMETVEPFVRELASLTRGLGLTVQRAPAPAIAGFRLEGPGQSGQLAAVSLAARYLRGVPAVFEFLPPRQSAWAKATTRFASRRVLAVSAAAAVIGLGVGGAFLWQQWRLVSLGRQWRALEPRVREVEHYQQQSRKYRAYFDKSLRGLRILRCLTEAFPEEGAVTAKTVEIKDLSEITCLGQAQDNQAVLRVCDRLRATPQVLDLKVPQLRGNAPLQFSLSFRWAEGGKL